MLLRAKIPTNVPTKPTDAVRLTHLSSCAGCAAKLSQALLADVLRQLPKSTSRDARVQPNVLVNASTFDDAGIYRLRTDLALVQTVDFFTPIVDDAFAYGQIAAANALSDVYAMGGRPVTAMNLLGVPTEKIGTDVVARILAGGARAVEQSGAALVGGHTIKTSEPIYGLSVTGVVHPKRILTNAAARPGDLIVLTKPLGTGIITTAIKRAVASPEISRRVARVMTRLNTPGADLAEAGLVCAATDVTGFGLTGHLGNVVRGSNVFAEVTARSVPMISREVMTLIEADCVPGGSRSNLDTANEWVDWGNTPPALRVLLADAQTSGGLLLFVPPKNLAKVVTILKRHKTLAAAVIGRILRGKPGIRVV